MTVRTRFAPSPTGPVHIGNIRTAIYNWLYARHTGGQFLLRLEDTDRERSTPEAVQNVLNALDWLGLSHEEEPLYQSQRREAHLEAAERLLSSGAAYKEDKGGRGQGEAVLFRMPGEDMSFQDIIRGSLRKASKDLPDFVIVRSDGSPVFHLANVVDDIHMTVTHIIRGDDHIENTFRHIALYRALGAEPPRFAHLPMIVNEQGKPYSKRDGAAFVGEFREQGFLPDALFNYLVLLGWSPGDDREVLTRDDMIECFELSRVQSAAARMDVRKLLWMNGEYLRRLPPETVAAECRAVLEARGLWSDSTPDTYYRRVIELMHERLKVFTDIADSGSYFFTEDYPVDEKAARKRLQKEGAAEKLKAIRDRFAALDDFSADALESALRATADAFGVGAGEFIHPVRVAVSGLPGGPGLFEMLELLGKERVLRRIDRALTRPGAA